jgi:hypothetical protein
MRTSIFMCDAYDSKPRTPRAEIEERIRSLRMQLWADPGDKAELQGMIEAAEAELRSLDRGRASS